MLTSFCDFASSISLHGSLSLCTSTSKAQEALNDAAAVTATESSNISTASSPVKSVQFQDPVDDRDISKDAERWLEQAESESFSVANALNESTATVNKSRGVCLAKQENGLLLFLIITVIAATYMEWQEIKNNHFPFHVTALWMALMFLEGFIVAENRCDAKYKKALDELKKIPSRSSSMSTIASEDDHVQNRRSFLLNAMSMVIAKPEAIPSAVKVDRAFSLPSGFYSCLQKEMTEPNISEFLLKRLLRPAPHTRTPDGKGIIPMCKYRGMDVFLTDSAEDPIHKNVYLNKCGLRNVPTLVINVILAWANFVVYYEMPHWVKNFDDIEIEESDPDDVKVFKKFLKGDTEYRRLRLQFLPCLINGPYAIKLMVPQSKELIGRASLMSPFTWYAENESTDRFDRKQCALIEASTDVTTSYLSRTAANMLRRYFDSISLDVAFVIDQPELQSEYEPSCVLGLFQMSHLDITKCAVLPMKSDSDNIQEASIYVAQLDKQNV